MTAGPPATPRKTPTSAQPWELVWATVFVLMVLVLAFVAPRFAAPQRPATPSPPTSTATPGAAGLPGVLPTPGPAVGLTATQEGVFRRETEGGASGGFAVVGRDGYVFIGEMANANLSQAVGRRQYAQTELASVREALEGQRRWLAARRIPMAFVVAPAKWSVYPDELPAWTEGMTGEHILDQLLQAAPDGGIVDLRAGLREARSGPGQPYSRQNSHWSDYGAYLGLQATFRVLAQRHPQLGPLPLPALTGVEVTDQFAEFAGQPGVTGANDWAAPRHARPLPDFRVTDAAGATRTVPGTTRVQLEQLPLRTEYAAAPNPRRVLVLGDSMMGSVSPYLATVFRSTLLVGHHLDNPQNAPSLVAAVEQFRPELVVYLVSERNLNVPMGDGPMWSAALRFDAAGEGTTLARWPDAAGQSAAAPALGRPSTEPLRLTVAGSGGLSPLVLRIETQAEQPGVVVVSGAAEGGAPVSVPVRVAPGAAVTYVALPALAERVLTITPASGTSLTVIAAAARPIA